MPAITCTNTESAIKGHLVYRALLTQDGTAAPVATVLENTLGAVPVWTYSGVGWYTATLAGAFPLAYTFVTAGQVDLTSFAIAYPQTPPDSVSVSTNILGAGGGASANDLLYYTPFQILVYI